MSEVHNPIDLRQAASDIFYALWIDYADITTQAEDIWFYLEDRGEKLHNDHIALRCLSLPGCNEENLATAFRRRGYQRSDEVYVFPEKKLRAHHYAHEDESLPLVFISELQIKELSYPARVILEDIFAIAEEIPVDLDELIRDGALGRQWSLHWQDYERLRQESEYAAWLALWGWRANHFTISVNSLHDGVSIEEFVQRLEERGFHMNVSGGKIKGSEEVGLKQASTLAADYAISLPEHAGWAAPLETRLVPSCYVEFAERFMMVNNAGEKNLFRGFKANHADRIFESTDHQL